MSSRGDDNLTVGSNRSGLDLGQRTAVPPIEPAVDFVRVEVSSNRSASKRQSKPDQNHYKIANR